MRRAFLLFVLAVAPLSAQTPLPADASVHATPGGLAIGALKRGAVVRTGATSADWRAVVVEGWIVSARLGTRLDTLDRTVIGTGRATLRSADGPSQPIVAELDRGTLLKRLSERNGWTQVRRSAWVRSAALARAGTRAPAPQAASPAARAPVVPADASTQKAMRATALRGAPGGDEHATIRAGTTVETLAHEGGWARVRIEGWVPERDLTIADSAAAARLSAADLRADPAAHRGKVVRWDVQVISVQRADPLRRALAADEPYLLARGPGDEGAILYIAIPPSLLDAVRALPQLSSVTVTARVRDGRSPPVGAPLLDLIALSKIP